VRKYKDYKYRRKIIKNLSVREQERLKVNMLEKGWEFCGYQLGMALFRREVGTVFSGKAGLLR
jgi:hypothetical protein